MSSFAVDVTAAEQWIPVSSADVDESGTAWYSARHLPLEGRAWTDVENYFDRLPARAKDDVRAPVWSLSHHSAGMCLRFRTNSPRILAHWKLLSDRLAMNHMAATGVSGLDLYVRIDSTWRWLAVGRPNAQENQATLVSGLDGETREYLLYFPLYNGVTEVRVGIDQNTRIGGAIDDPAVGRKPIVFWGTSITQGGCASRTGMVHTAIVGRWLNRPVVNLGFSGNGKLEPEMARLIAEIDAEVFVLDCLPNLNAQETAARIGPVVEIIRDRHPKTPILLVEDRIYSDAFLNSGRAERNQSNHRALRAAFERMQNQGIPQLYYLKGADLLGDDSEDTVDGSHPTDLGFFRQAQAFRKALLTIPPIAESTK